MNGLVKNWNDARAFGLIEPLVGKPGITPLIFFHKTSCHNGVIPPTGCEVKFLLVRGTDGRPQAADVTVIQLSASALDK